MLVVLKGLKMYGLVIRGLKRYICQNFSAEKWVAIQQDASVYDTEFSAMQKYPDPVTYRLVESASRICEVTPTELLKEYGRYWVSFAADAGYDDLLSDAGSTMIDVMSNLNGLHERVAASFPELRPPTFDVQPLDDSAMRVRYLSSRPGLTPFVEGLLYGLAERLGTSITVTLQECRANGHDSDIFLVTPA